MARVVKIRGNTDLTICFQIRHIVFILGQNVPENLEIDGLDGQADHYLIYVNDIAIGTARVRLTTENKAKIQRVAILPKYQGHGYGSELMRFIIADLRQQGNSNKVMLGAQLKAISFYERLGFTAFGEVFLDAGIEHQMMNLDF